jgi:excisionase family DNA binding protein
MMEPSPAFLTPKELADRLGVSTRWVLEQIDNRTLPVLENFRRPYRIPVATLSRLELGGLKSRENRKHKKQHGKRKR